MEPDIQQIHRIGAAIVHTTQQTCKQNHVLVRSIRLFVVQIKLQPF